MRRHLEWSVRSGVVTFGRRRRISFVYDCNPGRNANANAGANTRSGPAGSARPASYPGGKRQLRKCATVGSARPGDHPHREDISEYGMLDPRRVQVRAIARSGPGSKDVRWCREHFLDLDCRKQHDAGSVADLCDVRLGQWADLHHCYLEVCTTRLRRARTRSPCGVAPRCSPRSDRGAAGLAETRSPGTAAEQRGHSPSAATIEADTGVRPPT